MGWLFLICHVKDNMLSNWINVSQKVKAQNELN